MQVDKNGNIVNDCTYKVYGFDRKKMRRELVDLNFFIKKFHQYNYVGTIHKAESDAIIKRMNFLKEEFEKILSELK